jgi:hypothetical protein
MKITRISPVSHKDNSMEIDVTQEQLDKWRSGALIQHVMPKLTPSEREFIITGTTPEEWDTMWEDDES